MHVARVLPVVEVQVRVEQDVVAAVSWFEAPERVLVGECFLAAGVDTAGIEAALREAVSVIQAAAPRFTESQEDRKSDEDESSLPF